MVGIVLIISGAAQADAAAQTPPAEQTPPAAAPPVPPQPAPPLAFPSPLPTGRVTPRTLSETYREMAGLADSFPERVTRFELPHRSRLGQRIWGLEISHNVQSSSGKPVFLLTGLHHGDEWPTVELTMEFVHDVLQHDGVDTLITSLLDQARLVVVPIINPDGFDKLGRSNSTGVDPNRNYGAFWSNGPSKEHGEAPFSEPETQNIRDLLWSNQVTVALNNHTGDKPMVLYPDGPPAEGTLYDSLAQALGTALKWPAGTASKILYVANGVMDQTAYYSTGAFTFTFESTPDLKELFASTADRKAHAFKFYSFVIDQYFGTGAYTGSSVRAAFLQLFAAAATPALHSVLRVRAPAGATLTLRKSFTMETASDEARSFPVMLTSSLTVPRGGSEVTWHVNPSSRPSERAPELLPEVWTLTCTRKHGRPQTVEAAVARGEVAVIDMHRCR